MKKSPWIEVFRPSPGASIRLYCIPHAGGSIEFFRPWSLALPRTIEIGGIVLPGRGSRSNELSFTRIRPLVENLVAALGGLHNQPFALFGHSMGALIAFELARSLVETAGPMPIAVFVSGLRSPQLAGGWPKRSALPDDELLAFLQSLQGTPEDLLNNKAALELFLPPIRADLEVMETYRFEAGSVLSCAIAACAGSSDPNVAPSELQAWAELTTGHFRSKLFSGSHFYLQTEWLAVIKWIVETLGRCVGLPLFPVDGKPAIAAQMNAISQDNEI